MGQTTVYNYGYSTGYSKGAFKMTQMLLDRVVEQGNVFSDCRSKKQYEQRLIDILTIFATNQRKRERFLETGTFVIEVDAKGKLKDLR